MAEDRKTGFFPETVGHRMRDNLLEQTMFYITSRDNPQIEMVFKDKNEDEEYEFRLKYKTYHTQQPKRSVVGDEGFYRKPTKQEAEELGLDADTTNTIFSEGIVAAGSTDLMINETFNTSSFNFQYVDDNTPYQYQAYKNFLEKKVGNTINDNGQLTRVCDSISTNLLNFCRDAILNTPDGDIPSGFKFGYQDQTSSAITFLDLHYVNPDADPNDRTTWVYTHLPSEKVMGKSATENPRVHFLDPAVHGGSYLLPKIYIEPCTYSGWLGMIKTFVPEVEKSEEIDNGFLNVTEITKRVKYVEENTEFDYRLSLSPDCNTEIQFDKQFAQKKFVYDYLLLMESLYLKMKFVDNFYIISFHYLRLYYLHYPGLDQ